MTFIMTFLVCLAVWCIFPRLFTVSIGLFVGFTGGGLLWGLSALVVHSLITLPTFLAFVVAGTLVGLVIAVKAL